MARNPSMKPGDFIGIDSGGGDIAFWVEVVECDAFTLEGHVINGCWTFTMDLYTGDACIPNCPGGPRYCYGWKVAFTGPIPKEYREHYEEALWYMNQHKSDLRILGWWRYKVESALVYWHRFKKSLTAFKTCWDSYSKTTKSYPGKYRQPEDSEDDDQIPF